jgi:hypothetical protein
MFLKYAYVIFIGVLLAAFVGVGIAAFYKAPMYPDTPVRLKYPPPYSGETPATISAEQRMDQEKAEKDQKIYREKSQEYNKIVSLIALTAAIIVLIISLTVIKQLAVIADGAILGGVLTLIYSIIRGFEAQDDIFRFLVVTVGLLVALTLGYLKFIKPQSGK